jgi:hypothetical protein
MRSGQGFVPSKDWTLDVSGGETHHPPGSAMAASWASLTFRSSRPFNDISLLPRNPNRCLQQQVSARCRLERWRHARKICVVAVGFQGYGLAGVHWHWAVEALTNMQQIINLRKSKQTKQGEVNGTNNNKNKRIIIIKQVFAKRV